MRNGAVLALWLLPLWATGDALVRPATAFRTVRHRKLLWLLPGPLAVAGWFAGDAWPIFIGLALLLVAAYLAKVRDLVRVAEGLHRDAG